MTSDETSQAKLICFIFAYHEAALGGVFCSSGFFCTEIDWKRVDVPGRSKTPVYMIHGEEDNVIPEIYARLSYKKFSNHGIPYKFELERYAHHHFTHDSMKMLYQFLAPKIDHTLLKNF